MLTNKVSQSKIPYSLQIKYRYNSKPVSSTIVVQTNVSKAHETNNSAVEAPILKKKYQENKFNHANYATQPVEQKNQSWNYLVLQCSFSKL